MSLMYYFFGTQCIWLSIGDFSTTLNDLERPKRSTLSYAAFSELTV